MERNEGSQVLDLYTIHSCVFCQQVIVETRDEDVAEVRTYDTVSLDPVLLAGPRGACEANVRDERPPTIKPSVTIGDAAAGRDGGCVLFKTLLDNDQQL